MKPKSKILIIAGSDSSGGAGIQADIKTITSLGSYAMSAVTAVTVQNTEGVKSVIPIHANEIENQIIHTSKDIKPDAIKIGMLHSSRVVKKVLKALSKIKVKKIVLDPVMFAKGGAKLIDNPISKAPGYQIENVFVLAGVPRIMQAMYEALKDRLVPGEPMKSRTIIAFIGEGKLAEGLGNIQIIHSQTEIGSYPFIRDGRLGTALVLRSTDQKALDEATQAVNVLVTNFKVEHFEEISAE